MDKVEFITIPMGVVLLLISIGEHSLFGALFAILAIVSGVLSFE